jgi:hypothetical protein
MPGFLRLVLAGACLLFATDVTAQQNEYAQQIIDAKYQLSVGLFLPERQFTIGVNGSAPADNQEIEFDEELKLKNRDQIFAAEALWNFERRWRLSVQYFHISESVSRTLENDIEWEDVVYEAGSSISAYTAFTLTRLFLGWEFLSEPHHTFGVGFGIQQMKIKASIEGFAIVDGGGSPFLSESVRTEAPMPSIGFWYNRVLGSRWAFAVRGDWLAVSINPYNGSIINTAAGFSYAFNKNFGAGLNYNYFELDAGIRDDNWRGHVDLRYHGPYISIDAFW